jgi:hypothetical protein
MPLRRFPIPVFLIVLFVAASLASTVIICPVIPGQIAYFWDAGGEPVAWMDKMPGLFVTPLVLLCFAAILLLLPQVMPSGKVWSERSLKEYYWFSAITIFSIGLFYEMYLMRTFYPQLMISSILVVSLGILAGASGYFIYRTSKYCDSLFVLKYIRCDMLTLSKIHNSTGKLWVVIGLLMLWMAPWPAGTFLYAVLVLLIAAGFLYPCLLTRYLSCKPENT